MIKMKTVLMIGIGLIGSSLARCIKEEYPDTKIIGFSQDKDELFGAKQLNIIDDSEMDLKTAAEKADIIFLCTPVSVTLNLITKLSEMSLKKSVLITDVGSTKQQIVAHAKCLTDGGICFIAGHPMAGSHKSGYQAADSKLFENAYYILIPSSDTDKENIKVLKKLLKGTHAKFLEMTAAEHDEVTGLLSHLPHIVASGLVNQSEKLIASYPNSQLLAAGGFRDLTRIASSNPEMWTDILLSNRDFVLKHIEEWEAVTCQMKAWLSESNQTEIYLFFERAKAIRNSLPVHKEGAIPAFHDLYVNVPDYPGAIAEVTAILATDKISLINVKIIETRDDIFGILQLTFKNRQDMMQAKKIISKKSDYSFFY